MQNKIDILQMISQYENQNKDEAENTKQIKAFLDEFSDGMLFDRKNFVGHITASAYIINPAKNSILLLKHKVFDRWLQPGGHVDEGDSTILNAALREAEEETGIQAVYLQLLATDVFHIDSHPIPYNQKKEEPAHVHHDISYGFTCDTFELNIDKIESTEGKWVLFKDLASSVEYSKLIKKVEALIG